MGTSTCIKETTLHHYREPLAGLLGADPEIDFQGVLLAGTSDVYVDKRFVGKRTASVLDAMRTDGFLISLGAWGNPHIDFAAVVEFGGDFGIPAVGLSFNGSIAQFIVNTPHMLGHIDLNKTAGGAETCIIGESTIVELDAVKALAILKNRIRKRSSGRTGVQEGGPARSMRNLEIRTFPLQEIETGASGLPACLDGGCLKLDLRGLAGKAMSCLEPGAATGWLRQHLHPLRLVKAVRANVIRPGERNVAVNSILDFAPIAVKVEGALGEGSTHLLGGAQLLLTAVDENGFQPVNFGAAQGRLGDAVCFGRPGTPAPDDFLIHVDVLLKAGGAVTREGIAGAHLAADIVIEEIRRTLAGQDKFRAAAKRRLLETYTPGRLKVALVKMVGGDGAMNDTALFPDQPGGFMGSSSIMDLTRNLPVIVSPNEYADGIVRALN
jgi:hypothetical protein